LHKTAFIFKGKYPDFVRIRGCLLNSPKIICVSYNHQCHFELNFSDYSMPGSGRAAFEFRHQAIRVLQHSQIEFKWDNIAVGVGEKQKPTTSNYYSIYSQ